ncbi:UDP-forming cellulose synthase catalytic subunit [Burkholderiaceae bacterium DAT-1]|nr:UDP-forming cellulose synthase catalytic subunit [Burkholderiaceae bacterium DAT-1]
MNPRARLAAILMAFRQWICAGVSVQSDAPWRLIIWRLFILPPASAEAIARDPVLRWGLIFHRVIAQELGIPPGTPPGRWLWRLFFLTPARKLPWIPAPVRWLAVEPVRIFWRWIDRIDYERLARHLDAVTPVLASHHPWQRAGLLMLASLGLWVTISTPLSPIEQVVLALIMWLVTLIVGRIPREQGVTLMIALSLTASSRYLLWRLTETMEVETSMDRFLAWVLFLAEGYAWLILVLGFLQTAMPLKRRPVVMPADVRQWPKVDIFVPTYNEPLHVVRPTVLAAMSQDWPADKFNVYILDDGRREQFREFAREAGCGYIIRPDNHHAKAGNLNHALKLTDGEVVAIFDCDHIPTRSFLQMTVGCFIEDPKCVMVQTPHHFFSADPFERNLGTFRNVPNEGELFYGVIQDGNDLWNATFFCGSCAVIRKKPLLEVGGIAVETVTEDAHTALKLHRRGYRTAYINLAQAAGLATESLSGHIGQRIRWARGMAQIFRIDNPFLGKGLHWMQRVCYANAMLHFFYGIPRLVFLTAPLGYLFFQAHIIETNTASLACYVIPHILLANLTNSRIQGKHRHSFWSEVYEAVLAWYVARPTTLAFINPRIGKFNVTAKGGLIEEDFFDWTISRPYLILLLANLVGLILGCFRLFYWNTFEIDTVLLNMIWTVYNLAILGATLGVAMESRQVRVSHRIAIRLPAVLSLSNGRTLACETEDYSEGGLGLTIPAGMDIPDGALVSITLTASDNEYVFPARVSIYRASRLGLRFENLTMEEERNLVQCTFGRADAWVRWSEGREADKPLTALKEILFFSLQGYRRFPGFVWQRLSIEWRNGRSVINKFWFRWANG